MPVKQGQNDIITLHFNSIHIVFKTTPLTLLQNVVTRQQYFEFQIACKQIECFQ